MNKIRYRASLLIPISLSLVLSACGGGGSSDSGDGGNTPQPSTPPSGSSLPNPSGNLLAFDDRYEVGKGETVTLNVLENDVIPEGRTVVLSSALIEDNDSLRIDGNSIIYTAPNSDSFSLRFNYTITDDLNNESQASVSIMAALDTGGATINARDDLSITLVNEPVILDVLANDESSVDDDLSITEILRSPRHGVATIVENQIHYQPNENFIGNDNLTYKVVDESGNAIGGTLAWIHVEAKVEGRYTDLKLSDLSSFPLEETGVVLQRLYNGLSVNVKGLGNVNDDQYDDFITCYDQQTVVISSQSIANAGECFLVFGAENIAQDVKQNSDMAAMAVTHFVAENNNARLGFQVEALGDVNGDEHEDILLTTYENSQLHTYVFLGSNNPEPTVVVSEAAAATNSQLILLSSEDKVLSVSPAGDINNDQINDIAFVQELENNKRLLTFVFGGEFSENINIDQLSLPEQKFSYRDGRPSEDLFFESFLFGSSVKPVGDVNHDGIDDVMIRVADELSAPREQGVFIVFGRATYPELATTFNTTQGIFIQSHTDANLGSGLTLGESGDFNGDGTRDILFHLNNQVIIYSLSGIESGRHRLDEATQIISRISDIPNVAGWFVGLKNFGDINADRIDDLAVHQGGDNQHPFTLIYGNSNFADIIVPNTLKFSEGGDGSTGVIIHDTDSTPGTALGGYSSAAGDLNGDGLQDFLIGGKGEADRSGSFGTVIEGKGEVNIFFGSARHWGRATE